ncbi:two-component hybrid sensor and regulator [Caldimonas brevitalea]|uniref:histidine kinase n=1 Tax=Caldimonas brevitalea TaxID=413882 RepID=A0A0G3BVU7_9BURK|nr:two-component hybrid sensor and regulator [Caldimonas brevitalea]
MVALVLVALAPVMVVETIEQVHQFKRHEEAAFQEAQRQAELVSRQLEQLETGYRELLVAVAATPVVKNRDPAACYAYLETLQRRFKSAFTVGASDAEGNVYCVGVPYVRDLKAANNADRWYFKQAVLSGEFTVGEYAYAKAAQEPVFHYSYPIKDNADHVIGVVWASISLTGLSRRLADNPLPPGANLVVTDRRGTVLIELPDTGAMGSTVSPDLRRLLGQAKPGAAALPGEGGAERIVGYVPPSTALQGMAVTLTFPREQVLAPVWKMAVRRAATVLGAVALALALAWMVARRGLYGPLSRLTETANRWREGDLGARTDLARLNDIEFSGLGATLDQMAENLALRQHQLSDATEEMRRSRDEALKASLSKTHFLAAASHDLRQPLQAMHLNIALLAARHQHGGDAETIERLRRSVANLVDLLNALLDVSQLDAGLIQPTYAEFDLQGLLQTIGEEFSAAAQQKRLDFSIDACRCAVRSDKALLGRMLRNLVSNAIKYTGAGGSVRISVQEADGEARVLVADTGEGIPLDKQEVVFEEFRQLGNPQRNPALGLGLGLSIVKRMSALLQHPLTLASQPGEGTTFTVSIPLAPRPEPVRIAGIAPSFHGRVLLVEDDVLVGDTTAELLRSWGLEVEVARDAETAIKLLKSARHDWDGVLADYRLPASSGLDVVMFARKLFPKALTILITGDAADARTLRGSESNVQVLEKPVPLELLAESLAPLTAAPQPKVYSTHAGGAGVTL